MNRCIVAPNYFFTVVFFTVGFFVTAGVFFTVFFGRRFVFPGVAVAVQGSTSAFLLALKPTADPL